MEQQQARDIITIAMKYGLIQGLLSFGIFYAEIRAGMPSNGLLTAVNTALLIALTVLTHWELKRIHHGKMTYPQGLASGALLSSVGAFVRCVVMYVYVKYLNTGYLAGLMQVQQAALERRGVTPAQAQMAMGITAGITTPLGIAVTSLITGVIVGFIVSLIISIFTRNDPRTD